MICDVNVKPCIMLCMCPRLFLSFAPSCNKPNNFHGCFQFPPHPKKKKKKYFFQLEGNIFTAVSRSDMILIEGEIPMVLKIKIH